MYPKLFVFNHRHFGLSLENQACSLFKPIAKKLVTVAYLGIVMHLVDVSCVLIAFFSSSSPPVFFNFFTKLFTAFSDHLSTSELSPFFHPSKVFTIGGVKGERVVILFLVKTHFNTTVTQILAISTHCLLFLHSRVVYLFFHRMRTWVRRLASYTAILWRRSIGGSTFYPWPNTRLVLVSHYWLHVVGTRELAHYFHFCKNQSIFIIQLRGLL